MAEQTAIQKIYDKASKVDVTYCVDILNNYILRCPFCKKVLVSKDKVNIFAIPHNSDCVIKDIEAEYYR